MESIQYICSECKKNYYSKKGYKAHLNRQKSCLVCSKVLCNRLEMRKHQLTHLGENMSEFYNIRNDEGQHHYQPYYVGHQQPHSSRIDNNQYGQRYEQQQLEQQHHYQLNDVGDQQGNSMNYLHQNSVNQLLANPQDVLPQNDPPVTPEDIVVTPVHPQSSIEGDTYELQSMFSGRVATHVCGNKNGFLLPENYFSERKLFLVELLKASLIEHTVIKFNMEIFGEYIKPSTEIEQTEATSSTNAVNKINTFIHTSKMKLATFADDVEILLNDQIDIIKNKMSEFQERDSGWALQKILKLHININKTNLTRGSQYINTPNTLASKKACLNIENHDEYCFKWCMVAALSPTPINSNRTTSYNINICSEIIHLENGIILNFENMEFPLTLQKVKVFEKKNDISVNVFGYEKDEIVGPYHLTKNEKDVHVNLMLLHNNGRYHYILIKNMSR